MLELHTENIRLSLFSIVAIIVIYTYSGFLKADTRRRPSSTHSEHIYRDGHLSGYIPKPGNGQFRHTGTRSAVSLHTESGSGVSFTH